MKRLFKVQGSEFKVQGPEIRNLEPGTWNLKRAAGVGDMDAADAGGGMMLQSVIISPTSKAAIISGVLVKLGEKYGDAVLVKVAENEVVLKSGTTSQVLKLYPGVDRSDAAPADAKNASRRSKPRGTNTPATDGGASPR